MRLGYHASHEQFSPEELLRYGKLAEVAGFSALMSSDHITPWSVRQGQSGFTWAWLAALLEGTKNISVGSLVIPGGWRYHPILVAHAFATLARMYPDRVRWIAAGSGEAMNERMFGQGWPEKDERNKRMTAGVEIIRALWRGEDVTREGSIKAEGARLWSLPHKPPFIYGAALCEETAALVAGWADGLITVRKDPVELRRVINAFKQNGGEAKPLVLQLQLSWAESVEQARTNVHDQWRHIALQGNECAELKYAEEFDVAASTIKPEEMDKTILLASNAEDIIAHIKEYEALGFEEIYLHNAGRNQQEFIAFCGQHILPAFKYKRSAA